MARRSAEQAAAAFLARREHSRRELQQKLMRHYAADEIATALDKLQTAGLLCEQRFVESIMRGTANRYGRARLQETLTQHGIAQPLIDEALATLPCEEERAMAMLRQKYQTANLTAARIWRFLQSRGFDAETAEKVAAQFNLDDSL